MTQRQAIRCAGTVHPDKPRAHFGNSTSTKHVLEAPFTGSLFIFMGV